MKQDHSIFRSLPPPWDRFLPPMATLLVWGMLFAAIYLLRSFFLLLFLTFVFSFIQARGVNLLAPAMPNRPLRVVVVALFFLSIITAVGIFLVPKVKTQTEVFASQFSTYLQRVDQELFRLEKKYPLLGELIPEIASSEGQDKSGGERRTGRYSPSTVLLQQFLGLGEAVNGLHNINQMLDTLGNIGGKIAAVASAFLLALLFSFLIVLDLANLSASVRQLESTRLWFIYHSVADNIREFSQVLGRALEAQLFIASINALLTAFGITLLGLSSQVAFLAVIVFFCGFFPVIGVFISSVPICLVALQSQGLSTMLLAIVLIIVIHLIEGYILNPRIYGSYMRINSVIILIILTLGGKLFGFWGLLLGVPVCTYVFGYAIRFKEEKGLDAIPPGAPCPEDESPPPGRP